MHYNQHCHILKTSGRYKCQHNRSDCARQTCNFHKFLWEAALLTLYDAEQLLWVLRLNMLLYFCCLLNACRSSICIIYLTETKL